MAIEAKPGQMVKVTIKRFINRESARKTLERLFLKDSTHSESVAVRSDNFKPLPKRRGGRIWTKRPNKIHLELSKGESATIKATAANVRDLNSVESFVDVAAQ